MRATRLRAVVGGGRRGRRGAGAPSRGRRGAGALASAPPSLASALSLAALPLALLAAVSFGLPSAATAATRRAATTPAASTTPTTPSKTSELWATVDICNTPHHANAIGIRGSMPGDGHAHDVMYMRFLVQSLDVATHKWANIGTSADSGFVKVGSAAFTRQAGRNFEFKPTASTYTLRGLVEFQWHRGNRTVRAVTLPTSAGHTSLAGAEPKGFSAATCALP